MTSGHLRSMWRPSVLAGCDLTHSELLIGSLRTNVNARAKQAYQLVGQLVKLCIQNMLHVNDEKQR